MITGPNTTFTDAECESLYDRVLASSSLERQSLHMCEEMSELGIAISHHIRGRVRDLDNVAEEMADVIIMIDEMRHLFGISRDELKTKLSAKLAKFRVKVEAGMG